MNDFKFTFFAIIVLILSVFAIIKIMATVTNTPDFSP